jgi:hypothetical protein
MDNSIARMSHSRDLQRQAFIKRLGLQRLNTVADSAGRRVARFNWPRAANGTRYDRTVLIVVYSDRSWRPYLDVFGAGVDDWVESLEGEMVHALHGSGK